MWHVIGLLTGTALAQEVPELSLNAQLYRPAVASPHFLWTDESALSVDRGLSMRLAAHQASDLVVYRTPDGERVAVLDGVSQADVAAAWRLGRVLVGGHLPVVVRATSELYTPQSGLSDASGELRLTALYRDTAPLGLAVGGRVTAPTATVDGPLGAQALGIEGQLIADKQLGGVLLALNLGYRMLPEVITEEVTWDDQLLVRAGAAWTPHRAGGLSLDFSGMGALQAPSEPAARPLELLGGGWLDLHPRVALRAGVGTGIGPGLGAPRLRGIVALDLRSPPKGYQRPVPVPDEVPPEAALPEPSPTEPQPEPSGMAEVIVRVMDTEGAAIPGVTIQLINLDTAASQLGASSYTTAAGVYTLYVDASGYKPIRQELHLDDAQRMVVDITLQPAH